MYKPQVLKSKVASQVRRWLYLTCDFGGAYHPSLIMFARLIQNIAHAELYFRQCVRLRYITQLEEVR